ncbi:hypothetical protein [Membranihabitans maritimus]|uniref:hypothetical protein n=1 Tax=Membranihabitans maritimus TaxID=2904244 RepID=UPI001F40ABCB|nr:hypothetical protein [Membranihabitans maritimus]
MNSAKLIEILSEKKSSHSLNIHQEALWHIHEDSWEKAHNLVQDESDSLSCLIHAYLHKLEGDTWNANYWYSRADSPPLQMSNKEEWEYLANKAL